MFHLSKRIDDGDYDDVVASTRAALADQGFGVLTEIDVQATLKEKLDADMGRYVILGACNPPMAHRALETSPEIGALLPCNVVVREDGDDVVIDAMDPASVLGLVDDPNITPVATEVRAMLEKAVAAVA